MNIQTRIFHLNYDVLKKILLLVVASAGGVADLAKTMAVCKTYAAFGDDKDLLKVANFDNFVFQKSIEHCQHIRSLLIRCAEAGNAGAQYILAQVILFQFSQPLNQESYLHSDQASSSRAVEQNPLPPFLCYFMPGQAMNINSGGRKFTHFELVSLFLSQCNILDHVSMLPHVQNYVEHFRTGINRGTKFYHCYNYMTSILRAIVEVGRNRRRRYSPRLLTYCPIQPHMRNAGHVIDKLESYITYYFENSVTELSQSKWEELKRECQFIVKELLSFECYAEPLEENIKILAMGKRFFYYLAFCGSVTRDIELALDRDGDNLRGTSMRLAKLYNVWQHKAASAFDEMFFICPVGKRKRESRQERERETRLQYRGTGNASLIDDQVKKI